MTIPKEPSAERVERVERVAAAIKNVFGGICYTVAQDRLCREDEGCKCRLAARAALIAAAQALVDARIEGMREAEEIARTLKTLKAWLPVDDDGNGESEHVTIHGEAIANEICARIAALQSEQKERGDG